MLYGITRKEQDFLDWKGNEKATAVAGEDARSGDSLP